MPDAVPVQALAALAAKLDEISGLTVLTDRSELEPLTETEDPWPAALIELDDWNWSSGKPGNSMGSLLHTIEFTIEVQDGGTDVAVISTACANTIAAINDKIAEDYTLGASMQTCDLLGASGLNQDDAFVGAVPIRGELTFWTPHNDFTTIITG